MQARREPTLNQPALIPIAGNCDRKPRNLDRDVTTVGRARGSDLCLEANEISVLHCVFYRTVDGYRVRDCNSRCGTRVNGDSVKCQALRDGDIVNLGPFSFEFHLPPALFPREGVKLDPVKIEHWKNSRKKLAQRALKLRKRVSGGSPCEQDWLHKAHLLKEKIRSYDQRLNDLEDAENELTQERDQIAKESEEHRQRVQHLEGDLAKRFEQAEEDIRQKWQEFQKRCQVEEVRSQVAAGKGADLLSVDVVLAQLRREADADRNRLRELEEHLARQQDLLQREQQEFTTMKEQWVKAQTKSSEALEEQQAALGQQEAGVRAQKAELMRMMAELKKMQDDLRKQPRADLSALQTEVDHARADNAELRGAVRQLEHSAGSASNDDVSELRAELALLNDELLNKEQMLAELQDKTSAGGDFAQIRAENDTLKKLLDEQAQFAAQAAPKTESDLERYETELNEFRRQLENDRGKFNSEAEMLRDRNKELDEAIREMEMEMSKERAELARERMRLERVREEVKSDTERLQRELAVRDSMAPVQKLRDELAQKHGVQAKGEKPLNDRLRSMRSQLTDSSPAGS